MGKLKLIFNEDFEFGDGEYLVFSQNSSCYCIFGSHTHGQGKKLSLRLIMHPLRNTNTDGDLQERGQTNSCNSLVVQFLRVFSKTEKQKFLIIKFLVTQQNQKTLFLETSTMERRLFSPDRQNGVFFGLT